jgi:protein phosphatase
VEYYLRSDIGNKREKNEDYVVYHEKSGIFIIADGMGGHKAGEIASRMAAREFIANIDQRDQARPTCLISAFDAANQAVYTAAMANEDYQGMGTTLTAAMIRGEAVYFIHVGDTRAYKINAEGLKQLTRDHTLVYELYRKGSLTLEEMQHHPKKHLLTKALGTKALCEPDVMQETFVSGDFLLMCSDGLNDLVEDVELKRMVLDIKRPKAIVESAIQLANSRGGKDNISMIIVKFQD